MALTSDMTAIWLWPWSLAKANLALMETFAAVPSVLGARIPMLGDAIANPWAADLGELTLMVSEKLQASQQSYRSLSSTGEKLRIAAEANKRDVEKVTRGELFWPADFWRFAERNIAAVAAVVGLPGGMIAPVHKGVTGNAKRLSR